MNQVTLLGRLTKDIEIKELGGTKVGQFSLAVKRSYKNKNGEYESDFFNCKVFNQRAETLQKYCGKGQQLLVEGSIQINNVETENGKRSFTEVNVNNFYLLDKKETIETKTNDPYEEFGKKIDVTSEMLPF